LYGFLLGALLSSQAFCDDDGLKKALQQKLGTPVESVTKTAYFGLYEIYAGGQILYTDKKMTAILSGPLLDAKTLKNVTAERMKILSAIKFSDLPLDLAIKTIHGDGSRLLATFEDPNCGYCKRLTKDLAKVDNVTIYTFLYPVLGAESVDKSRRIWCSPDRAKAWHGVMAEGKAPQEKADCESPIPKIMAYGRKLALTGTPALVFADGERIPGAIGPADIEEHLNRASRMVPSH
jgi:thiol:disulfide interchange protein DsbC